MEWIKKHWGWATTLVAGTIVFIDPSVQHYAGSHAQYSTAIVTLWGIAMHWATSPKNK